MREALFITPSQAKSRAIYSCLIIGEQQILCHNFLASQGRRLFGSIEMFIMTIPVERSQPPDSIENPLYGKIAEAKIRRIRPGILCVVGEMLASATLLHHKTQQ